MLTRLRVKNFKKLDMDIELGRSVVFIGPNDSGKTTALQAITLWETGLRQWLAKKGGKAPAEKRPGVMVNRQDLISIPVSSANLLWKARHVRNVERKLVKQADGTQKNKQSTQNIRIDIIVDGIAEGKAWSCGLEFDYFNEESFAVRPIREEGHGRDPVGSARFTTVPTEATTVRAAFLPPMSGLAAEEPKLQPGYINKLLGQGQTAQVLRNLCLQVYEQNSDHKTWLELCDYMHRLFGAKLLPPVFVPASGEITMEYTDQGGVQLGLSASGRGFQQTLLLLAHLYANPKTTLLLDEPDAHLEILRQREIYRILSDVADKQGSQMIAASHSEVVLNEAAGRGQVIAFIGKPHVLTGRPGQLFKSLSEIGFDQYYLAQQTGWVLYLEAPSDLAILQEFARLLDHRDSLKCLARPFVHYVGNNIPGDARRHFHGLCEAKPDLTGIALFDHVEMDLQEGTRLIEAMWAKREIENYFCSAEVLFAFAAGGQPDDLFAHAEHERRLNTMRDSIKKVSEALETFGKPGPWSVDIKASDDFLDPLFADFSKRLKLPLVLRKSEYSDLVKFMPKDKVDPEVKDKLDAIVKVANKAKPASA